jgi:formate hydrogenlyase subunit 4
MKMEYIFALGCLAAAPLIGGLLEGMGRVLNARMQQRQGPPVLQPFYDFFKLLGKENTDDSADQALYAGLFLAFSALALVMLSLKKDLLLIVFMYVFAACAQIIGALTARSTGIRFGARKDLAALVGFEPVMIAAAIGIYFVTGSFKVAEVFQLPKMLIVDLPLIFIAYVAVLSVKLRKPAASFEFCGSALAVAELARWVETVFLLGFAGMFFATNVPLAVLVALIVYLASCVTWQLTQQWNWRHILFLCLVNLAWLFIKFGS